MRLRNSKCGSVGRHSTDAEIGMRPQHRVTHCWIDLIDHTNKSFRRDYRAESADAGARTGTKNNGRLIPDTAPVQRLGGNEAQPES